MPDLTPFEPLDIARLAVVGEPVEDDLRLDGAPRTGSVELGRIGGVEVGVWEMTSGAMRDIEADEIFVVVSGQATVDLLHDGRVAKTISLSAGSICRLEAGMHTRWSVSEDLRKVYILGEQGAVS